MKNLKLKQNNKGMTSRDELFETIRTEIEKLSTQILDHIGDDEYPIELVIGRWLGLKWALKEIDKNFHQHPLP